MGEDDDGVAAGDLRQPLVLEGGRGRSAYQGRRDHRGGEVGFQQQPAAQGPHHQPGFLRTVTEAAVFLVDVDRQHAEIAQRLPDFTAPAGRGVADRAALFERVVTGHEAPHGVLQRQLFLGEVEVHGRVLTGP
jgi:hypothetical protein